jgi:hypothetical protein
MRNGDISNETPPRIIVHIDVVTVSEIQEEKKLLRTTNTRKVVALNNAELSRLWKTSDQYGLSVELIGFESDLWTQSHLDKLMERLDNRGGNPFNYSELYDDVQHLISELPYRSNLKGVVDTRERIAMYGSYGIELENL